MKNINKDDESLFKKFLDRELSKEELEQVQSRVKTDKAFAKELSFQVAMKKAVREKKAQEEQELGEEIQDLIKEEEQSRAKLTPKIGWIRQLPKIAAALIPLFIVLFLWYLFNDGFSRNRICQEELGKMSLAIEDKNFLNDTKDFAYLIQQKSYPEAIKDGKEFLADQLDKCKNNVVNYQLGKLVLYYQKEQDLTEAIRALECIFTNYERAHPDIGEHLARAYLWSGNRAKAIEVARTINTPLPPDLQKLLKD